MYALFTAIPLVGHLNPIVRQADALRRRGWRVAVATFAELRGHVEREAPGTPIVDLGPLGGAADTLRADQESASRDRNFPRGTMRIVRGLRVVWPAMFDGLRASVERDRPDVIVVDLFASAGLCVAEAAGIPFVVNNPDLLASIPVTLLPPADHIPFLFSGKSMADVGWGQRTFGPLLRRFAAAAANATVGRDLNALRASRGLPPIAIDAWLRDRPIVVDNAFPLEYERPLPPNVHMVGPILPVVAPTLPDEWRDWLANGPPVVYVNLGTLAVASDDQLGAILEALRWNERRALWILAPAQARRLPPIPSGVRVVDWGPPPFAILAHPNVRAFVSHCGINSAYEAIAAGTPIVGIPMFADQRDMAVRVADAGAGVWLDKHRFDARSLGAAIERVARDPAFAAALPPLQRAFAAAGGVARAADIIERSVRPERT